MIATGNHNFEKFAALCNTLSGEPRRLRRSGRQVVDPYRVIAKRFLSGIVTGWAGNQRIATGLEASLSGGTAAKEITPDRSF